MPFIVLPVVCLVAMGAIGLSLVGVLHGTARDRLRRHAAEHGMLAGRGVITPFVDRGVVKGDPGAVSALDRVIRTDVLRGPVVRVKLWSRDGTIVYSDETRLVGQRFPLQRDELEAFAHGRVTSELSNLSRPENRFERHHGRLLETYTGVSGPDGTRLLFETYERFDSTAASRHQALATVGPVLLAGLVALLLANLAFASWFARHIRRRDQQRAEVAELALGARDAERRQIAAGLHDGVVQDLSAAALSLSLAARDPSTDPRTAAATAAAAAATVRSSVDTLRALLTELHPESVMDQQLPIALRKLVAEARRTGAPAVLDIAPGLDTTGVASGLLLRVAQEALRNAVAHAHARRITVSVGSDPARCWVEVTDDGVGFDVQQAAPEGHIGLRSISDLLGCAGGGLQVISAPGGGTRIRGEVPRDVHPSGRRRRGWWRTGR